MIQFFNTLSGKKEDFTPLKPGEAGLYTCGPTVYDYAHIGNFRTFVFEDVLRRFLEYKGLKVRHVMNITDVDDKTIAGANRDKKTLAEFTEKYTREFQEDLKALNVLPPNLPAEPPRATREIPAMIELIGKLVEKKAAYVSDGSVYYRVSSFLAYGKLSKKKLEKNIKGARVDVDEYEKEDGSDFVLWKKSKEGEPSWDSPWGKGRPGWHVECSAMSMKYLGESFDLHAGGEDLIFPHHENEIAQSEAVTGRPFVRYWLHCKHLSVNGEKMSKSKGNFYTLRDLTAKGYDPLVVRYALLSVHHRTPLNFTLEGLEAAKEAVKRVCDFWYARSAAAATAGGARSPKIREFLVIARNHVEEAMEDDLNTSRALGALFAFISLCNTVPAEEITADDNRDIDLFLREIDRVFGVFQKAHEQQQAVSGAVLDLVKQREQARAARDFKRADEIREEIRKLGYLIEDTAKGMQIKKNL